MILSFLLMRVTITDEKIEEGEEIMKCRVPGCETVWVVNSKGLKTPDP